jgi:hypothetical protein
LKFDNSKKKLVKIIFNETEKYIIKDKDKLFETLDISNNEMLSTEINKKLIESKFIKEGDSFEYVDFIYDYSVEMGLEQINKIKGGTFYFFFEINKTDSINIIRYDNYENEWLIGDFKEESIDK